MAQKEIIFPAGVNRRLSFRQEVGRRDRYFAPWATNVRLEDVLTERLRGGSFTGISAAARPASIVYRGRTLTFSGRAITASRVGDSTDTTLSSDVSDMLRPALFQFSEAETQGADVVALVPHKDHYLLQFSASETWVQAGDPLNGPRRRISDEVGIIGADAWCVAHDTVYFLSSDGLYSVGADGSGLKALSENALPVELTGIADATATLTYQHSDRGVYIHTTGTDWHYDTAHEGFWPFDTGHTGSYVAFGPFQLGSKGTFGRLNQLHGITADSSVDVTWRVLVADTAEQVAINAKTAIETLVASGSPTNIHSSGTWSAGVNNRAYPRSRGKFMILILSATTGNWAFEGAHAITEQSGAWR